MNSVLNEYLSKKMGILDYQQELHALINKYNDYTGREMFIYAADINKGRNNSIDISLVQDDFYIIQDILRSTDFKKVDVYLETPGGSGEAAEEIARFLRKKYEEVNFVIAGECKSAGTILALSGDNINMTDSGSLGPIDAQVKIGRYVGSAHDYKEWMDKAREEASKNRGLNPVDALMIAQISPMELGGVINSLEYAKDLVKEWLELYKFKSWVKTEGRGVDVTPEMRKKRAEEVAEILCNHSTWRTHGRSLKIEDLREYLYIYSIDDDPKLADIVYRIKIVIRLIFEVSTTYKLFYLKDSKIHKNYTPVSNTPTNAPGARDIKEEIKGVDAEIKCPKCNKIHVVNGYFNLSSEEVKTKKLKINPSIDENNILVCDNCNFNIDLNPIIAHIEQEAKQKVTIK